MRNLLLTLSYLGTNYSGWQVQPNAPTIQQTLQDAVESLFSVRENVTGCSRTDSGVHANNYCCNIRTDSLLPCETIVKGLNAYLPDDIAVKSCREMHESFHARYDSKGKEYLYVIHNSAIRDPFSNGRAWHYKYPLDERLLNDQARAFIGEHDFKAFCSSGSSVSSTVRTVKSFSVFREDDRVFMKTEADGFLYNMVRIMVGTLTDIQSGRIRPDTINEIIASRDRDNAGITAPPEGLYLNRVIY